MQPHCNPHPNSCLKKNVRNFHPSFFLNFFKVAHFQRNVDHSLATTFHGCVPLLLAIPLHVLPDVWDVPSKLPSRPRRKGVSGVKSWNRENHNSRQHHKKEKKKTADVGDIKNPEKKLPIKSTSKPFLSITSLQLIILLRRMKMIFFIKLIHPGRLTWNLRMQPWKRKINKIIFQTIIFRFHVNLRGCNS